MKHVSTLFLTLGLLAGSAHAGVVQEHNKKIVTNFYNAVVNEKDFDKAKNYLGAQYIQHNPEVPDGPEGLKQFVDFLKDKHPNTVGLIKHTVAEGDIVILHVHSLRDPGTRGRVVFDMFRVYKNKIVEHWDAAEEIPVSSANNNGVF